MAHGGENTSPRSGRVASGPMTEPPTPPVPAPPDPAASSPAAAPSPAPTPAGGERRRLDRAPGERYADGAITQPAAEDERKPIRWLVAAIVVADVGALAFFVLGLLDIALALVLVAGFFGWATGVTLVYRGREAVIRDPRRRIATASFLGSWAVAGGMLLDWAYGLAQGGVLGLVPYTVERYGLVALAALVAGAFVAAYRAR